MFTAIPTRRAATTFAILAALFINSSNVRAQRVSENKLLDASEVIQAFTANEADSIPLDLLQRAHGIAIIPGVFRGGFILGGRRGRGVLVVRSENNEWSNPAFITLTGGSIGWQVGAESADMVLIFANDRSIVNIRSGKFTLGGDASAVAGPLGKQATMALTFRAEVYGYMRSRGLYAGAAFQGVRLDIDEESATRFYAQDDSAKALGPQSGGTPASARRFLLMLEQATMKSGPKPVTESSQQEVQTFPIE
jgi:lipid-binding SYLF domain-containing protein